MTRGWPASAHAGPLRRGLGTFRSLGAGAGAVALARWLELLVPAACVACGRAVGPGEPPLCRLCHSRLSRVPGPRCGRCGEPLGTRPPADAPFDACGLCDGWPEAIAGADAPFAFEGVAAAVVRALKFGKWRVVVPVMASTMVPVARRLAGRIAAEDAVLVPVPLTQARLRERGFNQARDLADALSREGGWPVRDVLKRLPGGRRQARSPRADRAANVDGRFVIRAAPERADRPVLIVDDVLTTGATAHACATVLREAGFGRSGVVTFARTLRPLDG